MTADPALRRATYADLEAVPPHMVAEIIDGRLETHRHGVARLGAALGALSFQLEDAFGRPGDWIFLPRIELHFDDNVIVPDMSGWRGPTPPFGGDDAFATVAPDWVCELVWTDTARLDRGPKRRLYAQAGVKHLWLLDAQAKILECFALTGGKWLLLATFQPGDEVRVEPFDAVGFPFDRLFPFDTPITPEKPSEEA